MVTEDGPSSGAGAVAAEGAPGAAAEDGGFRTVNSGMYRYGGGGGGCEPDHPLTKRMHPVVTRTPPQNSYVLCFFIACFQNV